MLKNTTEILFQYLFVLELKKSTEILFQCLFVHKLKDEQVNNDKKYQMISTKQSSYPMAELLKNLPGLVSFFSRKTTDQRIVDEQAVTVTESGASVMSDQ